MFATGGTANQLIELADQAPYWVASQTDDATLVTKAIAAIPSPDLVEMQIPPRQIFLAPWIAAQSISMVFATRGTGKTFFLMSTAAALASGSTFLGWPASAPRKVAYVEGELPLGHHSRTASGCSARIRISLS